MKGRVMVAVRRLTVLAVFGALAAALAGPAAARPNPALYPETLPDRTSRSTTRASSSSRRTPIGSHPAAGDLAAHAEGLRDDRRQLGLSGAADDGAGRIDVLVQDLSATGALDSRLPTTPGRRLDRRRPDGGRPRGT